MRRGFFVGVAVLALAVWVALGFMAWRLDSDSGATETAATHSAEGSNHAEASQTPQAEEIEVLYTFDTTDVRKLVGYSDNVFIGTVERSRGTEMVGTSDPDHPGQPHTRFDVRVEETIRSTGPEPLDEGDVALVDEVGGVSSERSDGSSSKASSYVVTGVVEDETYQDTPLQVGAEYLFCTRYWNEAHAVSAQPHGKVLLSEPSQNGGGAALDDREDLVEIFRRAARSPVDPLDGEVQ